MPAYAVIQFEVSDPQQFESYKRLAGPTMAAHGGRLLARTGDVERLEEQTPIPSNLVLVAFDSVEAARRWYASPEYRSAIAARETAATMTIAVLDGAGA